MIQLREALRSYTDRREVPGLVALVSRRGEVQVETLGNPSLGATDPIQRDAIFRISSMTKPITAAAAMILVDEGVFGLDDPVERFLPELAHRRVLARPDGPTGETLPARRAITVRDLLSFRLGFGHLVTAAPAPIVLAEGGLGLATLGPPTPATTHPPDEWLRLFASLPLMFQPGERWLYNTGAHLAGILVARAGRRPFGDFLRERIFAPLGMKDTDFWVPAEKRGRLVACYRRDPVTGDLVVHDRNEDGHYCRPPIFPDGAAGLVSTVDDFHAFAQMLLRRGEHRGKRSLSAPSVDAMTTNLLAPAERSAGAELYLGERGWGLGMAVGTARPTRYGWDGGYGSTWANDSASGGVGILLTQRVWDGPVLPPVCRDFWAAAWASLYSGA